MRGISVTTPKLDKAQLDSMKRDPYTMIKLKVLNMCEDGDEVDYMDLWTRGLPVRKIYKFDKFKVKGTMDEEFTTKNLTRSPRSNSGLPRCNPRYPASVFQMQATQSVAPQ